MKYSIGIDIGGTNTVCGLASQDGQILATEKFSTRDFPQVDNYLNQIADKIEALINKLDTNTDNEILGVGIGAPNGNYYHGTIEYAPNLPFNGIVYLKRDIEKILKTKGIDLKVTVTNDANAAAMGEMIYGKAKDVKDFIMITLGTGVGSGIVVNGRLVYGSTGFAGEVGHTIIEPEGRQCNCGRKGCVERYCSATGIVVTAKELLKNTDKHSLMADIPKERLSSKDIYDCAVKGDELALQCFDITAKYLALGIANAAEITSPEKVFLFGGLANSGELLIKPLREYLEKYLFSVFCNTITIEQSGLKESDAAVLGAAALSFE